MGLARYYLSRVSGLNFYKLLGTGSDHGFTFKVNPLTNTGVYAILAVWADKDKAKEGILNSNIFKNYKNRSKQNWTIFLKPISVRGKWSGKTPFTEIPDDKQGEVVALTRATIKLKTLMQFWKKVPDVQNMIASDKNVIFKIGLGEIPWFHQVTFSIWPNQYAMDQFARENGPHAEAIRSVRKGDWFREELYARFKIYNQIGNWSVKSNDNAIINYNEVT